MPNRRHPECLGGLEISTQVIDEDAALGGESEALQRDRVDPLVGLADAELLGEHDDVELGEVAVVGCASRSSRPARCGCRRRDSGRPRRASPRRPAPRRSGAWRDCRGSTSSAAASRRSNSASGMAPLSRSISAWRASGWSRNARLIACSPRPSRALNASNAPIMLVVRTPPQSIRSPSMPRSAGSRCRGRGACGTGPAWGRGRGTRRGRGRRGSLRGRARRRRRGGRAGAGP